MADQAKSKMDGREISVSFNPERPVPMKFFATWEVERSSPNCIPRVCNLKLTRLEIIKCLEPNLTEVVISVSMQASRRTLRSNGIILGQSGLIDTVLDLSFSLQYPHFLKRNCNNLQIMLQRRKKYKNRTILGFKTLAVGVVNMAQVLQYNMDSQLKLYAKGSSSPVARFTVSSLTSQPVDTDQDRPGSGPRTSGPYDREGESTDDDDDSSLSEPEVSDSAGEGDILDDEQRRQRKLRHGKMGMQSKHQNFKQKFIALLKKFKMADEDLGESPEQYLDIDISPPENEMIAEDYLYDVDDLDDDSDDDTDILEQDNISISSTPKPSLRPFFDVKSSLEHVSLQAKINEEDEQTMQNNAVSDIDERNTSTDPECNKDTLSPPSEIETHSDNTSTSDPASTDHDTSVRRSVSFKEKRNKVEPVIEYIRRNSDVQNKLPKRSLSDQLITAFPSNDQIPENILLVNTAEWQGQMVALKLMNQNMNMICTENNSHIEAVMTAIVSKYQKFCNNNSGSPPSLRIGIAGSEPYVNAVLTPYVEQMSSKPPDWQSYIRFLVIPLGNLPIAKYLAGLDTKYNSMFADNLWKEAFEHSQSTTDFDVISNRVNAYMSAQTVIYNLPIAEALINIKQKGSEEGSSQVFVPFICDVRIGSMDPCIDDDVISTSGQPSSAGVQSTNVQSRADQQQAPSISGTQSPPIVSSSPPSKDSSITLMPSPTGSELMDLQVDYWLVTGNKKEATKCSLKTTFKSLVVTRLPSADEPGALCLMAITKERKQRGFEAMMRSMKKVKEKEPEAKNQPIVTNVSKLICTTKGQSSTLNVTIDGAQWSDVKFFSLSSQWPTHVKQFPIGLFSRVETP